MDEGLSTTLLPKGFQLVTNEQDTLQWELKSPANVKCFKKTFDFGKIVGIAIRVANSYRKVKNVVHHARLKNVFKKLIVIHRSTRLDLENPSFRRGVSIGVEALKYLAFAAKKHRNYNFVFAGLPFLHPESELFQAWPKPRHNGVAILVHPLSRIDGVSHFLEECDDEKAEFRRRRRFREVDPINHF